MPQPPFDEEGFAPRPDVGAGFSRRLRRRRMFTLRKSRTPFGRVG